ncbi:hypothetical protein [Nocardioides sp. 1609]|uniref:hypothetical protein n=1 Tax=Nocardioides sp. 1609 TaxID=2508327 RepID=UPI00106FDBFB|nr:hypothetical protein [Nocardioides sp. 1609]
MSVVEAGAEPVRPTAPRAARPTLGQGVPVQLVGNSRGDLALLARDDDFVLTVRTRRGPNGDWSTPHVLARGAASLVMDEAGVVTVVRNVPDGLWAETMRDGVWDAGGLIAPATSISAPSLEVNEDGVVVVAVRSAADVSVQVVRRLPGQDWGEPRTYTRTMPGVPTGGATRAPKVTVDPGGAVTITWPVSGTGTYTSREWLRMATPFGTSSEPEVVDLTDPLDGVGAVDTAVTETGEVVVLWEQEHDGVSTVRSLSRDATGLLTAPRVVATESAALDVIALGAHANHEEPAITWTEEQEVDGGPSVVRSLASRRTEDGWSDGQVVARAEGSDPASTLGASVLSPRGAGGYLAVWLERGAVQSRELWVGGATTWGPTRETLRSDSTWSTSLAGWRVYQAPDRVDGDVVWSMENIEGDLYPTFDYLYHARLDRTPPVATITSPTTVRMARQRPMAVAWGGTDASGIASYDVLLRSATADGAFGPARNWQTRTTSTRATVAGTRGTTYCFAVRATDGSGNVGPVSAERCDAVPLDDRDLRRRGRWESTRDRAAYGNGLSASTRRGATLSVPVLARRLALTVRRCRTCGKIAVTVGDRRLGTIDLAGRAGLVTHVLLAAGQSEARGTLEIRVLTRGRLVQVDAVGASRA